MEICCKYRYSGGKMTIVVYEYGRNSEAQRITEALVVQSTKSSCTQMAQTKVIREGIDKESRRVVS